MMNHTTENPRHYFSYLLRLWKTGSGEKSDWRASLEEPNTGEKFTFTSLERLFAFLEDQCIEKEQGNPED